MNRVRFFRTARAAAVVAGFLLAPALWALPSVQQVIDYIDTNYQVRSDMTAQAKITTRDPEQGTKIIQSVLYRRDRDDAFLIVIADPETDRGNGYLRVGDNMWLYRRSTRTFTHIGRDEKIGGSNASARGLRDAQVQGAVQAVRGRCRQGDHLRGDHRRRRSPCTGSR